MLSHLSLGVSDLQRSVAFYDQVLAPLGVERVWTHDRAVGYGFAGGPDRLALFHRPEAEGYLAAGPGFHVAFSAPDEMAVHDFHAAAVTHGGQDAGRPGPRPQYGDDYYAAYVIDPDGHKLEVKVRARSGEPGRAVEDTLGDTEVDLSGGLLGD